MNNNYAAQIIETMRNQNRPAWEIVGYLEAVLAGIQRAAEDRTSHKSILQSLAASAAYMQERK